MKMISHSILHHTIIEQIIQEGFAPSAQDLSTLLHVSEADIAKALQDLADYHGVVLHPNSSKIWVIHPFSLAPTTFIVQTKDKKWWGNCAWCSLGIAAILNEDVEIITTAGAHGESLSLHIENGQLREKDFMIHFPIPMKNAWDNVIYTCSTMLLFRDAREVDDWSRRHRIAKGDIQSIETIWEFSKEWYGNHRSKEWKKWTQEEAKQMFQKYGLTHPIWDLEESGLRF